MGHAAVTHVTDVRMTKLVLCAADRVAAALRTAPPARRLGITAAMPSKLAAAARQAEMRHPHNQRIVEAAARLLVLPCACSRLLTM